MYCCLHICISILCFSNIIVALESFQCDKNDRYNNIKQMINNSAVEIFDELLEKYGDVYLELENLIEKLTNSSDSVSQELNNFENNNQRITRENDHLASEVIRLLKELENLENQLNDIDFQKPHQQEESLPVNMKDVENIENNVNEWEHLVESFDKNKLTNDFMNLPYSISDEISFLERIISNEDDLPCLGIVEGKLRKTFEELSELLEFDGILKETDELKNHSDENKKRAFELLKLAEEILTEEKTRRKTQNLAEKTLSLALELEKLKSVIDKKSTLPNIPKAEIRELEDLLKILKTYENSEKFDIDAIQKEIEDYLKEINCFQGYISDCEILDKKTDIKKPPTCVEKVC